MDKDFATQTT